MLSSTLLTMVCAVALKVQAQSTSWVNFQAPSLHVQATCGGNCCGAGCFYFALSMLGVPCVAQFITRGEVRRAYGMQPAPCADFFTAMCCNTCDLCQVSREIDIRRGKLHQFYVQCGSQYLTESEVFHLHAFAP